MSENVASDCSSGHIQGIREPGSGIESVNELIGAAAVSGASLHIVHVNSVCMKDAMECIEMIRGARQHGLDYDALELPDTGERLTKERFDTLHVSNETLPVLIHMNPDHLVDAVMSDPSFALCPRSGIAEPDANDR